MSIYIVDIVIVGFSRGNIIHVAI